MASVANAEEISRAKDLLVRGLAAVQITYDTQNCPLIVFIALIVGTYPGTKRNASE